MRIVTAAALCLLLPFAAMAGEEESKEDKLAAKFAAADTNSDGKLTLDEAKEGMPRVASRFDKIDTEGKGYITLEQLETMMANRRK